MKMINLVKESETSFDKMRVTKCQQDFSFANQ